MACQEISKKENLILFKEEFISGIASPILPSLTNLIRNHGNDLESFFSEIPDITDYRILPCLEKLSKKYAESFACEIQYKAKDTLWKKTPQNEVIRI